MLACVGTSNIPPVLGIIGFCLLWAGLVILVAPLARRNVRGRTGWVMLGGGIILLMVGILGLTLSCG